MLNEGDLSKVVSAYSILRFLLLEYRLRPGMHLQINDISEQMRLSVTPVREALARLWVEKLVDNVPNRGYFVKAIDPREQFEIHDAKSAILEHALREIPTHRTNFSETGHGQNLALPERIALIYSAICSLAGNSELKDMVHYHCARTYFLRQLDCETNEDFNLSFISEMSELLLFGESKDALRLFTSYRQRLRRDMPVLLKEAAGRASLQKNCRYMIDRSLLRTHYT